MHPQIHGLLYRLFIESAGKKCGAGFHHKCEGHSGLET